jgi:ATP-dependent DNA helicase RecQ
MQPLAGATEIGHQILATATDLSARGRGRAFGVGFLVSVLVGSRTKVVLERHGEDAVGFAALAGEPSDRVASWVHQLADLGLLEVSEGQYPVISVTTEGKSALDKGAAIELVENAALLAPARNKSSKSVEIPVEDVDRPLFEKLRSWRRSVASERGVPAYVILHDATLMRIAAVRPSSLDRLSSISGIGVRRAEDFGPQLIDVVSEHCTATGLPQDQEASTTVRPAAPPVSLKTSTYHRLFREGVPVQIVADQAGIKPSTTWRHLAEWVENEKPDSINPWVDEETQKRVVTALFQVDSDFLKPVYELLEGSVPYEVIRVVKAFGLASSEERGKGLIP